jgi:hypothetical protein
MRKNNLLPALCLLMFACTACVMPAKGNPLPQVNTREAELPATETMTATSTPEPSETITVIPSPRNTATPTPLMRATPTTFDLAEYDIARDDRFTLLEDVNYPDASVIGPATLFMKTWRIENSGSKTWNANYIIASLDDNTYNGPITARLMFYSPDTRLDWNIGSWPDPLEEVQPGEIVDVTLLLQTPNKHGYQFGSWAIINDEGQRLPNALWSQIQVQGAIPEDQLNWNSTWRVNDPFIGDLHYPLTLSLQVSDVWVHGYFYNHLGQTILISGLAGEDELILDALYGLPNQRVSGTRLLLQTSDGGETFSGTVWYDMANHGSLCAARTDKSYEYVCLPEDPELKETPTDETTPTTPEP